jgi:hypothetical protein
MQPGQPNCRYHSEPVQEDFLVLHCECIAIVEGEERPMRQWDFLHSPAGVEHVFVGAGDSPCAILMIGSRRQLSEQGRLVHRQSVAAPTGRVAFPSWPPLSQSPGTSALRRSVAKREWRYAEVERAARALSNLRRDRFRSRARDARSWPASTPSRSTSTCLRVRSRARRSPRYRRGLRIVVFLGPNGELRDEYETSLEDYLASGDWRRTRRR